VGDRKELLQLWNRIPSTKTTKEAQEALKVMHHVRQILAVTVLLLSAVPAVCKCANRFIYIDGQLWDSPGGNYSIKVEVTPDPNWEPQPGIVINAGVIKGKVLFNTTKAEGHFKDNCSRSPKTVEVVRLNGDREVDRVKLAISKDLVKTEAHDYRPRESIKLHAR
jgi:hypothetical protein